MKPPGNSPGRALWIVITVVLVFIALTVWMGRRQPQQATAPSPSTPAPIAVTQPPLASRESDESTHRLQTALASLKGATNAISAKQQLTDIRKMLAGMSTNAAVAAIRQFLDSKADASTHLGFKVGTNGFLDQAPTLRTFLLDELGRIDPAAAAQYSSVILSSMDSPDEWAVALRNLAWGDGSDAGLALLSQKTAQMLQYSPWQQNPSAGYLEAFDVAVYLGGTSLLPTLTSLVQQQSNPAVAHASYLALDRLVINNPTTTLTALLADPSSMQGNESTRADYFARADVRDPQQLQLLQNYLLNPQISPAEIDTFAGIFPNANYMISANLLTQTPTPTHAALVGRDAASLSAVEQWLANPQFASLRPTLQQIQTRLQGFVQQESQ